MNEPMICNGHTKRVVTSSRGFGSYFLEPLLQRYVTWKEMTYVTYVTYVTCVTWKEMKYGIAASEPQLPSESEQPPLDSSTIASAISSDQPSLVRHCGRTRGRHEVGAAREGAASRALRGRALRGRALQGGVSHEGGATTRGATCSSRRKVSPMRDILYIRDTYVTYVIYVTS